MPIKIYDPQNLEEVAWLADEDWKLPSQINELEKWLIQNENNIPSGHFVADVGFDIRKDASGGGAVLSIKAMSIMVNSEIALYLSEYPGSDSEILESKNS